MSLTDRFSDPSRPVDVDHATFANYFEIVTTHLSLSLSIDWDAQVFRGTCTVFMKATKDVQEVKLDTSYLNIQTITAGGEELKFRLGDKKEGFGKPLIIELGKTVRKGEEGKIDIAYETTKECTAVGWLTPVSVFAVSASFCPCPGERLTVVGYRQTKSGKYPYLYSQSQAIHARSLFPCQDTPAVKATYSARVKSILPVLMSALRKSPPSEEAPQPGKMVEYVYDQVRRCPCTVLALSFARSLMGVSR